MSISAGLAAGENHPSEWLGPALGLLGLAVALLIAWRQRVFHLRSRAADRAEFERQQEADRERQARVDRREIWRAEYEDVRDLLRLGEDIADKIRAHGPFTSMGLARIRLLDFAMEAQQLARRTVEPLREPLRTLARLAEEVSTTAVPTQTAVHVVYATPGRCPVSDALELRTLMRLAVDQDRAALNLGDQISLAWQALASEWGS